MTALQRKKIILSTGKKKQTPPHLAMEVHWNKPYQTEPFHYSTWVRQSCMSNHIKASSMKDKRKTFQKLRQMALDGPVSPDTFFPAQGFFLNEFALHQFIKD